MDFQGAHKVLLVQQIIPLWVSGQGRRPGNLEGAGFFRYPWVSHGIDLDPETPLGHIRKIDPRGNHTAEAPMEMTQPEIIQVLRRRIGLNQGDFGARAFNTSFESGRTKVKRIELGKQIPTRNDLKKMAKIFGVGMEMLTPGRGRPAPGHRVTGPGSGALPPVPGAVSRPGVLCGHAQQIGSDRRRRTHRLSLRENFRPAQ